MQQTNSGFGQNRYLPSEIFTSGSYMPSYTDVMVFCAIRTCIECIYRLSCLYAVYTP